MPADTVAYTFSSQLISPQDRGLAADCPDQELPAPAFGQGAFHAPLLLRAPHPFSWAPVLCASREPPSNTTSPAGLDQYLALLILAGMSPLLVASPYSHQLLTSARTRTSRTTHGQVLTITWQLVNAGQELQFTPTGNSPYLLICLINNILLCYKLLQNATF